MVVPIIAGALIGARLAAPFLLKKVLPKVISAGRSLIPKTTKGKVIGGLLTLPAAAAIATEPKKVFRIQKSVFKKTKKALEIIDEPSKAQDILGIRKGSTTKEKLITGAKAAGVVGLVAAAGLAGKKLLDLKEKKLPKAVAKLPALKPTLPGVAEPRPVGLGGIPVGTPQIKPIEAPGAKKNGIPISNIIQIQVR